MSAQKPGTNLVIDYWPSWSDTWEREKLRNTSDRVNIINIAFALPQKDGTLLWNDDTNPPQTKKIIKELQAKGKRITIAVGGATAHDWNLDSPEALKKLAGNIKKFVDYYGLDGVDIDYEMLDPEKRKNVAILIKELRTLMPMDQYLLTYAAWSIGAYGISGHEHPEWNGNKGIDVAVLKEAGHLLDWVNVMSYDAFDKNMDHVYNPIEAIEAYKSLMGFADKVVLGIELGNHGWPSDVITSTREVRPWMEYAVKQGFRGAMFWTLDFDKGQKPRSGEKPGAFHDLIQLVMPKSQTDLKNKSETKLRQEDVAKKTVPKEEIKVQADTLDTTRGDAKTTLDTSGGGVSRGDTKAQTEPKATATIQPPAKSEKSAAKPLTSTFNAGAGAATTLNFDVTGLSADHQKKVLEAQLVLEEQLRKIEENHDFIRRAREKQLALADPSQRAGLIGQFKSHDEQLSQHVAAVKSSIQNQLEHLIAQCREEDRRRARPC